MAVKKGARSVMRKEVGRKAAATILNKLDKMVKRGAPASTIEKMIAKELTNYLHRTIIPAVGEEVEIAMNQVIRPIIRREPEIMSK